MILEIAWVGYKIFAITCGLMLLYIACLLYKDEKDKIQDRLEFWWIKIYEYREGGFSAVSAFFKSSANLISRVIHWLFGDHIFSKKAVWGSFALTSASFFVIIGIIILGDLQHIDKDILSMFGMSAILPAVFLLVRKHTIARDVCFYITIAVIIAYLFIIRDDLGARSFIFRRQVIDGHMAFALWVFLIFLSTASDFLLVSLLRKWITRVVDSIQSSQIYFPLIQAAVTGVLLFIGPVYLGVHLDLFGPWGSMLLFLGVGNSIAALFGLSVIFASMLLLLKRVVFPVIERILYFIAAENIINKRKSLVTAALILIGSAWPEFGALLKELI